MHAIVRAVLHVTNGDAAAARLREEGVRGDVLPWRDVLHEGPVPAVPDDELRAVRARFLAGMYGVDEAQTLRELTARDERLAAAQDVVLWFETDLYDQLQMIDVLRRLPQSVPLVLAEPGKIHASLYADARPAGPHAAATAWAAFTAPTPEQWARHAPLRRLIQEVPWHTDALTRSERQLLRAVGAGARTPPDAFLRAQHDEELIYLGDTTAFSYLERMAPLVGGMPLALTPRGEAVLQRKDRWDDRPPHPLGGVEDITQWRYRLESSSVARRAV
jgi:uncharacterized protein DUF1835